MLFFDIETQETITEKELFQEWEELFTSGETESASFKDYVINCTAKNGTLKVINK